MKKGNEKQSVSGPSRFVRQIVSRHSEYGISCYIPATTVLHSDVFWCVIMRSDIVVDHVVIRIAAQGNV